MHLYMRVVVSKSSYQVSVIGHNLMLLILVVGQLDYEYIIRSLC